jgi:hypothetical protein
MSNFFVLNEALDVVDYNDFLNGLKELFLIDKVDEDLFLKHDSLWQLHHLNELYTNYTSQDENAVCLFIEQIKSTERYFNNSIEIDDQYPDDDNGFLGIDFKNTVIENERRVTNNIDYIAFNEINWDEVDFRNLWKKKSKLFPNLILCGEVKNQISLIGQSGYFNQIVDKLRVFNLAVENWKNGNFSYRDINANYALRISPESDQTMAKYRNQRVFQLPDGGTDYFELHIKTGDLRFHFLPDNNSKKVYVGYIGPHLSTISN